MSAVEKVQAAIDKLTAERDAATPGKWARSAAELDEPGFMLSPRTCAGCGGDWPMEEPNAELIVTLHRTIDAQLAILELALGDARGSDFCWQFAIPLATAILGDAS